MSSTTTVTSTRTRRIRRALAVVAVVALGALLWQPVTGADFTASDTGRVDVQTATLTIELSSPGSTGTFDLDFDNLKPGQVLTQTFKVKNTGSIAANAKLGAPITGASLTGGSLTGADYSELKLGVAGYQAMTSVTALPSTIDLGTLAAGQAKTFTVQVGLDQSAGNEWQDVKVGATATVTLTQS